MTQKKRLVELLKDFDKPNEDEWDEEELEIYRDEEAVKELERLYGELADYLLKNGVIVPPCKVGDELFAIFEGYITTARVIALYFDCRGGMFDLNIRTSQQTVNGFKHIIFKDFTFDDYGKKLFRTANEAEQALKERDK